MELFLIKYINEMLKKANYEYDSAVNSWCASVDKLPGVYAQADTIEDVRSELAEIIEEYVFVSLHSFANLKLTPLKGKLQPKIDPLEANLWYRNGCYQFKNRREKGECLKWINMITFGQLTEFMEKRSNR
jgi:predicted RNase H-like HicB family nuclease